MKRIAPMHLPKMRVQGLVIDDLPDEVLVYDRERDKAHCLNRTAALVWRRCDGKTAAPEMARYLTRELDAPVNEGVVWLALSQLETLHLLEQPISLPPHIAGMSRRQMVRTLGIAAAVAIPLVTSIVSPTPAEAGTCAPPGAPCSDPRGCCLGCGGTTCV